MLKQEEDEMPAALEWNTLEIDEEEWALRVAENGPIAPPASSPAAVHAQSTSQAAQPHKGSRHIRLLVSASALVALLAVGAGCILWQTAQAGMAHMQQDVSTAVQLEIIKAHVAQPWLHEHATLESADFFGGQVMAQALITRTLPSGQEVVQRQTFFYAQTQRGWQPTIPSADFWGPAQAYDTPHLHFVFGSKDRMAVEQLAQGAEALYVALQRATGQQLVVPGSRLAVEINLRPETHRDLSENGRIWLPSPLLFSTASDSSSEQLLAYFMRGALANQMLAMALDRAPIRPQWTPVAEGLRSWLLHNSQLPLAPSSFIASNLQQPWAAGSLHLSGLIGSATESSPAADLPWVMYNQEQLAATAAGLVDYLAATYGIDVLPALLQGFGQYDDWETLAPAVFGVSAPQLENGWRRAAAGTP